jgi:hypothetical protein
VRATGVALAVVVSLTASTGAAVSASSSGLRGVVIRGPTRPVCRDNEPCEEPARGIVLRFSRNGVVEAEVKTSRSGRYEVRLRPGRYDVKAAPVRPVGGLTPRVVRVPRARIARVDFHLDTGLQ